MEVLDFFAPGGQYLEVREKVMKKASVMNQLLEQVSIGLVTSFYHHGRVRYLLSFESNKDKFFISLLASSQNPLGMEPTCWISNSPEGQGHQLEVRAFQELAKVGPAEPKPWLKKKPPSMVMPSPPVFELTVVDLDKAPSAIAAEVSLSVPVVTEFTVPVAPAAASVAPIHDSFQDKMSIFDNPALFSESPKRTGLQELERACIKVTKNLKRELGQQKKRPTLVAVVEWYQRVVSEIAQGIQCQKTQPLHLFIIYVSVIRVIIIVSVIIIVVVIQIALQVRIFFEASPFFTAAAET
jgi:hypothetical protein